MEPPYPLEGHLSIGEAPQPPTTNTPPGVDALDYLRGYWRPVHTVCRTLRDVDNRPYLIAEIYGPVNGHHYSVQITFSGVEIGTYTYYPIHNPHTVEAAVVPDGTKVGDYLAPRFSWTLPIDRFDSPDSYLRAEAGSIAVDGHSGTIDAFLARDGATTAIHVTGAWRCA